MILKVLRNVKCPRCGKYEAERIGILRKYNFELEFVGCLCNSCGYKEKAEIIINQSQRKLL